VQSVVRAYAAPLSFDVDLWLYQVPPSATTPPLHSDLGIATPELLSVTLSAGSYRLRIKYEGFVVGAAAADDRCPTVEFELAITPLSVVTAAVSGDPACTGAAGSASVFPAVPMSVRPLVWDSYLNGSTMALRFVPTPRPARPNGVELLTRYRVHLVESPSSLFFYFEAMLGVDFLTGGSYGLMLRAANDTLQPGMFLDSLDCSGDGTCHLGVARYQSERFLKRLLSPGDYDLWLYERASDRVPELTTAQTCVPFTFAVVIEPSAEKASYLTCRAEPLPDTVDTDLAVDGWNYAEDALIDLRNRVQTLQVQLPARSAIRLYVDGGALDIDAKIRDGVSGQMLASGYRAGPEGLYAEVAQAGLYNITLNSFGALADSACSTMRAVVAIDTADHIAAVPFCAAQPTALPDLSGLQRLPFVLDGSAVTYQTAQNSSLSEILLINQTFTVTASTLFFAQLDHNFLIGPYSLWLTAQNDSNRVLRGTELRDGVMLTTTLEAGSYTFELRSGRVQRAFGSAPPPTNYLPPCAQFKLSMNVRESAAQTSLADASNCWQRRKLPPTLNTPAHLGTKRQAHLADQFMIMFPDGGATTYQELVTIGPIRETSLLRVVTQGHHVDIDLYLYDVAAPFTGIPLAHSVKFDDEEESVLATLAPGVTYTLKVVYYRWGVPAVYQPCDWYHLELAVLPVAALAAPGGGAAAPGVCVGGDVALAKQVQTDPAFVEQAFSFSQRRAAKTTQTVNLVFTKPAQVRADLEFNFARHHMNMLLYSNATGDVVARAVGNYDGNELLPFTVAPGAYRLVIEELASQTNATLLSCAVGRLRLASRAIVPTGTALSVDAGEVELLRCTESIVPPAFDNVVYLSPRTGGAMHVARYVLADTTRYSDFTDFTLTRPSLFRLRVPRHDELDIDLVLYYGSAAARGAQIASRSGFYDDSFLERLQPGQYTIEFVYHRWGGLGDKSCLTFPFEVAIEPLAHLFAVAPLQQACATPSAAALPRVAPLAPPSFAVVPHDLTQSTAFKGVFGAFNVTVPTLLEVDVNYDFAAGPINVDLEATLPRGSTGRSMTLRLFPAMGSGRAQLRKVLLPGSYVLTLSDVEQGNNVTRLALQGAAQCAPFSVAAVSRTDNLPNFECYGFDRLPETTFNYDSWLFGGPQNSATGSLRFFGDNFLLDSRETGDDAYVQFKVTQPSYVRIFIGAGLDDDIDIFVYRNQSQTDLLATSTASGDTESALLLLQPQTAPYLLNLYFFAIDGAVRCRRFTLELAIRPVAVVHNELRCPVPLPNEASHVPPQTMVFDSTRTIGNDSYYFTSDHVARNSTTSWFETTFRYRMAVSAPTGATLRARVGFDFLANNFKLQLVDAASSDVVAYGVSRATGDRSTFINFGNSLRFDIAAGKQYYLDLIEDTTDKQLTLGNVTYCNRFSLQVSGDVAGRPGVVAAPYVFWVYPTARDEINPLVDFQVGAYVSAAIAYDAATDGATFDALARARNLAYLTSPSGQRLVPYTTLASSSRRLTFTWNATTLALATTYTLHLQIEQLRTLNGTAFAPYNGTAQYSTLRCDCNQHGQCAAVGTDYVCTCAATYAGEECEACADGYHGVGSTCVADVPCQPTTCNGHGVCSSVNGVPNCLCDAGFATVGDAWCTRCQPGFVGYPNCTAINGNLARSPRCSAPLLPTSLGQVAYLGYIDRVHLSDAYYIDLLHTQHEIKFVLKRESVLRAYAERHAVDIDMWLYSVDAKTGDMIDVLQRGIGIDTEETMFEVLPPGTYKLKFQYFDSATWIDDFADERATADSVECQAFQFELAIHPTAELAGLTAPLASRCGANDSLPAPGGAPGAPLRVSGAFNYTPGTLFSVVAQPEGRLDRDAPYYFYSLPLVVGNPPQEGQVAVLAVDVGARFLLGDVGVVLEHGSDGACRLKATHDFPDFETTRRRKRQWDDAPSVDPKRCVAGRKSYDSSSLEIRLSPGNYTLMLYEPRPQNKSLAGCALFDLSLRVSYVTVAESVFNCDGVPVPESLMTPSYMATTGGYLQVQDTFQLRGIRRTQFLLTAPSSLLRARASGENGARVTWSLRDNAASIFALTQGVFASAGAIYAQLPAGNYTLTSTYFGSSADRFCLSVPVELSIEPYAAVPTCAEDLPTLPTTLPLPYEFNATERRFTLSSTQANWFRSFPFDVATLAELNTHIDSDFLRSDFRVQLMRRDAVTGTLSFESEGVSQYNRNSLRSVLAPGSYVLQLVQPVRATAAGGPAYAGCMPFNFALKLAPLAINGALGDCFARLGSAEALPATLDGERWLAGGARTRVHFQSSQLLVPRNTDANTTTFVLRRRITFTAPAGAASLMRLYIERHEIDIDVALHTAAGALVASGDGTIVGEETFTADLTAGAAYYIELSFWRSSFEIFSNQCPTFAMALEIEPRAALQPRACANSGDHLPALQRQLTVPFDYDSRRIGETLYLQQSAAAPREVSWRFTVAEPVDLYFAVSYDFIHGDLALELSSEVQAAETRYGVNLRDRNVIVARDVPAGTYVLRAYEPVATSADLLGCNAFEFEAHVQSARGAVVAVAPPLPSTFDGMAYLGVYDVMHISGKHRLLSRLQSQSVTKFTVTKRSVVRVASQWVAIDIKTTASPPTTLVSSQQVENGESMVATLLDAGTYALVLRSRAGAFSFFSNVEGEIEIAIVPVDAVTAANAANARAGMCVPATIEQPTPNGAGTYHMRYNSNVTVATASQLQTARQLQSVPVVLTRESVVFVRVGFWFPAYAFQVRLRSNTTSSRYGVVGRNLNTLNAVVPAGRYDLLIDQPLLASSAWAQVANLVAPCAAYDVSITIGDAADAGDYTDCSDFVTLPTSLNNYGNSTRSYGAPLDAQGRLSLYGDKFFMSGSNRGRDVMSLQVAAPSVVAIFTTNDAYTMIDASMSRDGVAAPLAPNYRSLRRDEVQNIFYLQVPALYAIELAYNNLLSAPCQFLAAQVLVRPFAELQQSLVCAKGATAAVKLPARELNAPLANGVNQFSALANTKLTPAFMQQYTDDVGFAYGMNFSVSGEARLVASLAFNSLVSGFALELYSRHAQFGYLTEMRGTTKPADAAGAGAGGVTLVSELEHDLYSGDYQLRVVSIKQNFSWTLGLPFDIDVEHELCLPFLFDMQLTVPGVVAVRVDPPGVIEQSLDRPLVVTLTFSESVFDANGAAITRISRGSALLGAVFLAGAGGAKIEASQIDVNAAAGTWRVTFDPSVNNAGLSFALQLKPNTLFSQAKKAIDVGTLPPFLFASNKCSGHGRFVGGVCRCDPGFTSAQCDVCDNDYYTDGKGGCVRRTGNACRPDSCGCLRGTGGQTCAPVGVCSYVNNQVTCTCPPNVDVATNCAHCKAGFRDFPKCVPCTPGQPCGDNVTPAPPTTTSGTNNNNNNNSSSSTNVESVTGTDAAPGSSNAAAIGGAVAGVAVVLVLVGVAVWLYRRNKSKYRRVGAGNFGLDEDEDLTLEAHPMDLSKAAAGTGKKKAAAFGDFDL
jgi:hypothetical protein